MRIKENYRMPSIVPDTQQIVALEKCNYRGFPGGAVVENLSANAGDTGSSPGL